MRPVIPADAGIQGLRSPKVWIPAFAGMTSRRLLRHDLRSQPAIQKPLQVILRQRIGRA